MSTSKKLLFRKLGHPQNKYQPQRWGGTEVNDTLNAFDNNETRTPTLILENHPNDSRVKIREDNIFQTLSSRMGTGGGNVPMVMENREEMMDAGTQNQILRILQEAYGEKKILEWGTSILATLQQTDILQPGLYEGSLQSKTKYGNELDGGTPPSSDVVAEWIVRDMRKQSECGCSSQGRESAEQRHRELAEIMQELPHQSTSPAEALFDMWKKGKGIWILREALSEIQKIRESNDGKRQSVYSDAVVRRLTPTECSRLQGYPDGWVDIGEWTDSKGKLHKDADSPKYKALGNSIALPFWQWMAERMVRQYKTYRPTMASLFDGIGGFPLVFKRCGCEPVWASEIEEFPIAVTKKHFGEDGDIDKYIESAIPETTRGGASDVYR